jgi:protein-tyrosine-phosphatase
LRESIPLPEKMTDYALRVVKSADWRGVAMVEFKVDQDSREPYLMEVNGRFWGSLQLAIDAGVDFPWLLYQGGRRAPSSISGQPVYTIGIKSRWWFGDLDHLLLRLWKADNELNLPPGSPSKFQTMRNFFACFDSKTKPEVFRWQDLRPAIYELGDYLRPLRCRVTASVRARLLDMRLAVARAVWGMGTVLGFHRIRTSQAVAKGVGTVLVLCKGNICRSPFAARYLELESVRRRVGISILSAGLDTTPGKPAYPMASLVSMKRGIDLSAHRTTAISKELIDAADLILVMELAHIDTLHKLFPQACEKTYLLGHFSSKPVTDIRDPYGKAAEEFEQCYELIMKACNGLLESLRMSPHSGTVNEPRLLRTGS